MKKNFIIAAFIIAASVISCTEKPVTEPKLTDLYFTSFGFYAEHNKGVITEDITFDNLDKTATIEAVLPHEFSPASLKTLACCFTLSSDTAEAYLEDGTALKGVDTLDFSSPVEIRLKNGETFWAYTVKLTIAESASWTKVAGTEVSDTLYTSPKVAYDEKNDMFYILDCYRKKGDLNYPVLYTFKDGQLSDPLVLAEVRSNSALGIEVLNGEAYVVYADYAAATAQMLTAVKVSGSNITPLGAAGSLFKCATVDDVSVIPVAANQVYAAYQNSATVTGTLNKRLLNVAKWNGAEWANAQAVTGRNSANYGYQTRSQINNGVGILGVFNQNASTISLVELSQGADPVERCEFHVANSAGEAMTGTSNLGFFDFHASKTAIYIVCQPAEVAKTFNLSVQKVQITPTSQAVCVPVAGIIPGTTTTGGGIYPSITVVDDVPYVAYQGNNSDYRLTVATIDPETKDWVVECVSNSPVDDDPVIMADKNGQIFVFALNSDTDGIEIFTQAK